MVLTYIFSILCWLSFGIFLFGLIFKLISYIRTPEPFKIPLTPGPNSYSGVFFKILRYIFFFEPLIKTRFWLWFGAMGFHICFLLVILRHLRFFFYPVPSWIMAIQTTGIYAGFGLLAFTLYLVGYRLLSDRRVYLSIFEDYLMIVLFLGIAGTGLWMKYANRLYLVDLKAFTLGLVTFNPAPVPNDILFIVHLILVVILIAYFPFGKLLHVLGVFMNPTIQQRDDVRTRRHLNPWDFEVE
jgi:nitrate reductase gamma subunit